MAITDLTGTTWTLNSSLTSYAGGTYSKKSYNINITTAEAIVSTSGDYHDTFDEIRIGYDGGPEYNRVDLWIDGYYYPTDLAYGHDTKSLPDTWNGYYTGEFTITGGADATNSTLISWLESNAEDVTPATPDIVISYAGNEIATMSDSGTKTLKTQGKYCTDDITIEYTKQGGGGITTALVSGVGAAVVLYYTDSNMTVQSGNDIINEYLPVGSIIAVWDDGPNPPDSPTGVTQIAQYGNIMNGRLTVYEVTG